MRITLLLLDEQVHIVYNFFFGFFLNKLLVSVIFFYSNKLFVSSYMKNDKFIIIFYFTADAVSEIHSVQGSDLKNNAATTRTVRYL